MAQEHCLNWTLGRRAGLRESFQADWNHFYLEHHLQSIACACLRPWELKGQCCDHFFMSAPSEDVEVRTPSSLVPLLLHSFCCFTPGISKPNLQISSKDKKICPGQFDSVILFLVKGTYLGCRFQSLPRMGACSSNQSVCPSHIDVPPTPSLKTFGKNNLG